MKRTARYSPALAALWLRHAHAGINLAVGAPNKQKALSRQQPFTVRPITRSRLYPKSRIISHDSS